MVLLVSLPETAENFDGVGNGGLTNVHWLEPPFQSCVSLDVLAVFIQGGGTDALQLATCQGRFEDVGSINGSLGSSGTDQGVHFVNDEDHVPGCLDLLHDFLEALLEFTSVFGTCDQKADVEGENTFVLEDVRDVALLNPLSESFSNCSFADTWFSDQDRIVLGATTKNLNHTVDFMLSTDDWIKLALACLLGEIATEFIEGWGLG